MKTPMSHEQTLRWVSLELDGELPAGAPGDVKEALDRHLATCDPCRSAADDLRQLSRLMRATPPARAPAGLVARAVQFHGGKMRRRSEAEAEARVVGFIRFGSLAAGLLIMVTSFFAFGGFGGGLHRSELRASSTRLIDRVLVAEQSRQGSGVEILWQMLVNRPRSIR